ncbi:MAG TPA: Xaa-Pro peptidase family protein [Gemmatimonadales bacterium]|nr:Xaa-Pro peptidase family protein [Gemmatimonadales bacterium]
MRPDRREERQAALLGLMERAGVEALLVRHLPNVRYLTGFSGTAGLLLVRRTGAVLITDFRYATQAGEEVQDAARVEIEAVNVWDRLGKILAAEPVATMGYEPHVLTVKELERLRAACPVPLEPAGEWVEELRTVKAPEEVEAIREAARVAEAALAEILPGIRVGQSERRIGAALESALRQLGSEWHPFPTIVASGPRSALPHARTSDRTVGRGEWVLLDFGAQVRGYCADLTRTVLIGGRADDRQREIYALVHRAQSQALKGIRPGLTGRQADALAREVIVAGGFGDSFGHSLGHGLGLEVHEAPRLSPASETPIPAHAVVTVEPGVYLPGWGGVRLEDDLLVSPDGPVCLSSNRTELLELT